MVICSNCWDEKCTCGKHQYIQVDDEMVNIICTLNKKGYLTRNCCEGHLRKAGMCTYVQFKDLYEFETIPEGFSYDTQEVDGKLLCDITRFLSISCNKKNGFVGIINGAVLNEEQLQESKRIHLLKLKTWSEALHKNK